MSTDLRYPIGPVVRVAALSPANRAARIAEIADLPRAIQAAVTGLADAQLDTPYRDAGWTVRQVVHHLADSHVNAFVRIKWALTEKDPVIKPYHEQEWAELPDAQLPVDVSLRLLDAVHERWVALLRALPEASFALPCQHPESGPHTVDMAIGIYAWHGRHHTAHIAELRKRSGW